MQRQRLRLERVAEQLVRGEDPVDVERVLADERGHELHVLARVGEAGLDAGVVRRERARGDVAQLDVAERALLDDVGNPPDRDLHDLRRERLSIS